MYLPRLYIQKENLRNLQANTAHCWRRVQEYNYLQHEMRFVVKGLVVINFSCMRAFVVRTSTHNSPVSALPYSHPHFAFLEARVITSSRWTRLWTAVLLYIVECYRYMIYKHVLLFMHGFVVRNCPYSCINTINPDPSLEARGSHEKFWENQHSSCRWITHYRIRKLIFSQTTLYLMVVGMSHDIVG